MSVERGVGAAARHGFLIACRNLILYTRSPASIVGTVVFPLIFFFGFLGALRRTMEAQGLNYAQYLPPIVVVQAMFFTGFSSAFFLADDRLKGLIERYRSLPINRWAVIVGRVSADTVRAIVSMGVVLAAAFAVGFRFHAGPVASMGFASLVVLFALTAAAGFGTVGLTAKDPSAATSSLTLPYLLLLMLSTGFVPAEGFPGWLQPLVRWQPVSLTVDALRVLADGGPTATQFARAVVAIGGLLVVFGGLAARAYRRLT